MFQIDELELVGNYIASTKILNPPIYSLSCHNCDEVMLEVPWQCFDIPIGPRIL